MKQKKKKHWFWHSFLITICLLSMTAGLFLVDYNTRAVSDGSDTWPTDAVQRYRERYVQYEEAVLSQYWSIVPAWFPEPTAFLPAAVQLFLRGEEEESRFLRSQWEKIIKK